MRAIVLTEHGPPSSLKVTSDAPQPPRGKGEALIKVVAAGVNPVDWKTRAGPTGGGLPAKLPKILGGDLSGVVLEAEEGAPFKAGDKVFALTNGFLWDKNGNDGCYCEVSAVPLSDLASPPATVSLTDAAAVPLVALTAWQTLACAPEEAIKGKRVLVHAGAGGVGHVALQLAKNARGAAFVAATGRPHSFEFLKSLGADEVLDYTQANWDEEFLKKNGGEDDAKFDVIFDLVAGDAELKSYKLLKNNGYYLHVFNTGTDQERTAKTKAEWAADGSGRHYEGPTLVKPDGKALAEVSKLIDEGKLKIEISEVLPLEEAAKAHEELEKLSVRGKIVLKVAEE
jgi:NADPH:quinone reductase-like Zn-dependent oxidoreductase